MILLMFDIDGTLTLPFKREGDFFSRAIQSVFGRVEINTDLNRYDNITDQGLATEVVDYHYGKRLGKNELVQIKECYFSLMWPEIQNDCREIDGAKGFIDTLNHMGDISISIATGNWREVAIKKLQSAGFWKNSLPLGTSSDALTRKDIMLYARDLALEKYKVNAFEKEVYFGDGKWDAIASEGLGWDFIGITTHISSDDFFAMGAKACFRDFSEPEKVLKAVYRS